MITKSYSFLRKQSTR